MATIDEQISTLASNIRAADDPQALLRIVGPMAQQAALRGQRKREREQQGENQDD